jgi:hypothetical protein
VSNTTTLNETLRSPVDYTEFVRLATTGANWKASLSSITRQRLFGSGAFYVATTGNDSNPGTIGSPWLTLQHAMNFISAIDGGGNNVVVNIGAGSFAGFGIKDTIGIGVLQFIGAGSTNTTITSGPNDGVFNFGECISNYAGTQTALIGVDKVTFDNSGAPEVAIVIALPGANFNLGNAITFVAADIGFKGGEVNTIGYIEGVFQCQFVAIAGAYNITMTGGSIGYIFFFQEGATFFDSGTWTLSGAADTILNATATLENGASYVSSGASYSGSVVGQRYAGITNSSFGGGDFGRLGPTFFPGTIAGTLDTSASYDRYQGTTIIDTYANILSLTPMNGLHAFASDLGILLFANGSVWQVDSSWIVAQPSNTDLGVFAYSNRVGYGKAYVTDKEIANCTIGYGSAPGSEGQIRHDPVNHLFSIYQNGSWQNIPAGVNLRIAAITPYGFSLEQNPVNQWIQVYSGDTELLSLSGLPVTEGYTVSMGAYQVPQIIDGGSF